MSLGSIRPEPPTLAPGVVTVNIDMPALTDASVRKPLAAAIAIDAMRRHEGSFHQIVACVFDRENEVLYQRQLA